MSPTKTLKAATNAAPRSRCTTPVSSSPDVDSGSVIDSTDWMLQDLPFELQVRTLSYLRAHDLSAVHQVNRASWQAVQLHHAIVVYCAEQVYPLKWTVGFEEQPISSSIATTAVSMTKGKGKANRARSKSRSSSVGSECDAGPTESSESTATETPASTLYTFEHLRNMELLVVARVLSSPEPATGFVVSKSWCKTALCWLEGQQDRLYQQQQQQQFEAMSKKKKNKKVKACKKSSAAVVAPPPANINSDITCSHDQLQHYTSTKSARARRRLLDKQAWKILKALYPESTPLPAHSVECLQCRAEACQALKAVTDQQEAAKQQRKLPLKDPAIRRFYTRTRGVPEDCIRGKGKNSNESVDDGTCDLDQKRAVVATTPVKVCGTTAPCPLVDGVYHVLPRVWCHGWRHFMKTGEGGLSGSSDTFCPPDAASLLCDAHQLALLPPHLEAFLYGESTHLLESTGSNLPVLCSPVASAGSPGALPPGQGPTLESIQAMRLLGLSENEINRQVTAMRSIEGQQLRLQQEAMARNAAALEAAAGVSRNELLDRENHSVVEILSQAEFRALTACWPGTNVFSLRFTVDNGCTGAACADSLGASVNFATPICRSCDPSGRQCSMSIKNRARGWVKKSAEKSRSPASLEY